MSASTTLAHRKRTATTKHTKVAAVRLTAMLDVQGSASLSSLYDAIIRAGAVTVAAARNTALPKRRTTLPLARTVSITCACRPDEIITWISNLTSARTVHHHRLQSTQRTQTLRDAMDRLTRSLANHDCTNVLYCATLSDNTHRVLDTI